MLLCHSLCYNEKYWASAPILMYQTKYILPFHDGENKHRQGVNDGSFQKHFRQPRNHRIRKAIPRHFRYSGYPHCLQSVKYVPCLNPPIFNFNNKSILRIIPYLTCTIYILTSGGTQVSLKANEVTPIEVVTDPVTASSKTIEFSVSMGPIKDAESAAALITLSDLSLVKVTK